MVVMSLSLGVCKFPVKCMIETLFKVSMIVVCLLHLGRALPFDSVLLLLSYGFLFFPLWVLWDFS